MGEREKTYKEVSAGFPLFLRRSTEIEFDGFEIVQKEEVVGVQLELARIRVVLREPESMPPIERKKSYACKLLKLLHVFGSQFQACSVRFNEGANSSAP